MNKSRMRNENTDKDVDIVTYTNKDVNNFDLDNVTILQNNDRLVIVILTFFSLKIPKNNNEITLKEEK